MILTTTWEKYFLKETLKIFVFFLLGFYSLYVLIDYSTHAASFKHYHFSVLDIIKFYAFEFVTRIDVLVPFALLIACIKTLCSLNVHNELVALMASGIRLRRLLLPFLTLGLIFTALIYLNFEILQPMAYKYNTQLDHSRAKAKQKKHVSIQQLTLEDGSSIIYRSYEADTGNFFDVFWIRSADDIYRIRHLFPHHSSPLGKGIDHFERNLEGLLVLSESFNEKTFPGMRFNKDKLLESVTLPEAQSLSEIQSKLPQNRENLSEKESSLLTTYYRKLAMPWLCLLAVLAPAPFCIRFSRTLPVFFIYALSIFGLVTFYLVMDAAVVLGERQMVHPAKAVWIPFGAFFAFFGYRFARL